MERFIFRRNQIEYACEWLDDVTFRFDFGDGRFVDDDGEPYFIHCEYHVDADKFIFEVWWEENYIEADSTFVNDDDKKYIEWFMKELMRNK